MWASCDVEESVEKSPPDLVTSTCRVGLGPVQTEPLQPADAKAATDSAAQKAEFTDNTVASTDPAPNASKAKPAMALAVGEDPLRSLRELSVTPYSPDVGSRGVDSDNLMPMEN